MPGIPPMPPMPPISGIPPPATPAAGSGLSATIASVVIKSPATDAAFCKADLTTLVGSITPDLTKSVNSLVCALKPKFASVDSKSFPTITAPSVSYTHLTLPTSVTV